MNINGDKIEKNLSEDDLNRITSISIKACFIINKLSLLDENSDVKILADLLDSTIESGFKGFLRREEDKPFNLYIKNYVKFRTFVTIYHEKNKKGFTYPGIIFNMFKNYIWTDRNVLYFDDVKESYEKDQITKIGGFVRKRRYRNLNYNVIAINKRAQYKNNYAFGSEKGKPGKKNNPVRSEKVTEFELMTILAHSSKTKKELEDNAHYSTYLNSFIIDKCKGNESDNEILKTVSEMRRIYNCIEWHKNITLSEYMSLHKFMYEYFMKNSDYKWLDIYCLNKRMYFQGMYPIIDTWFRLKSLLNLSNDWLLEMTVSVLNLPSTGLRICYLNRIWSKLSNKKMIDLGSIQKEIELINKSIQSMCFYTTEILQQVWDRLESKGLDENQKEKLLKALKYLINNCAENYDLLDNGSEDTSDKNEVFQIIYKRLYPPFEKQVRKKRT